MAEPRDPREPRIPKETAPFDADGKWTRTWIMYFESLFRLSVKEAVRQAQEALDAAMKDCCGGTGSGAGAGTGVDGKSGPWHLMGFGVGSGDLIV